MAISHPTWHGGSPVSKKRCIKNPRQQRSGSAFVLGIFLLALGLRVIPVLLTRQLGIGLDDMFQYDMLARSLASGNGFRWYATADLARMSSYLHLDPAEVTFDPRGMLTTFRAPLYPTFLALIYAVNGINDGRFFAARLGQAFLSALLAPLTYFLAQRIPLSEPKGEGQGEVIERADPNKAARISAWIIALYPTLLVFPLALATENLFFVLVAGSVLSLLMLAQASRYRKKALYAAISGVLLGLAALTRSVILPFAVLSVLWTWGILKEARLAALLLLTLTLTIMPWVIRNSLLTGKLTGIETATGYNLYLGYHPQSTGTFRYGPSLDLLSILDDRQRDETGIREAIGFIRQDPARVPYLALRRLGYFFNLELRGFTYFYVNDTVGHLPIAVVMICLLLLSVPFVVVSLSAAIGAALLPWRPETVLLLLLFVAYLLPHVLILSEERFHLTLLPFFAILAARYWTTGISIFKSRNRVVTSVSILVALLLLSNWVFELVGDWPTLMQMLGPNGNRLFLPY